MIPNEELWERTGQEQIITEIKRRKRGWISHILRKPATNTTRQALRVLTEWIRRRHVTGTSTIRQLRSPGPSPFRCKNGLSLERRRAGWQNV